MTRQVELTEETLTEVEENTLSKEEEAKSIEQDANKLEERGVFFSRHKNPMLYQQLFYSILHHTTPMVIDQMLHP